MNIASKVKLFSFGLLFGIIIRLFDKLYFYDYLVLTVLIYLMYLQK